MIVMPNEVKITFEIKNYIKLYLNSNNIFVKKHYFTVTKCLPVSL